MASQSEYVLEREDEFTAAVEYTLQRTGKQDLKLKWEQIDAVHHLYKDVLLWLPTGFSKSVCYEMLPFIMDHKRGKHMREEE